MGVSGVSEQTTQLGLFKWEDGPDRYNHIELYQNWDKIDSALLKKGWGTAGDEATQIRFGASGTSTIAATALIVKAFTGTADTVDRFNLTTAGSANWGSGGSAATDTNLYRAGSASLKTDSTFTAAALVTAGGISVTRSGTASSILAGSVSGDTAARLNADAAGVVTWGSGTAAADTNLYRSAADTLKTDDKLVVGSGTITLNDYNLVRSGAGTVTANGNFVITGNLAITGNLTLSGSAFQGTVSLSDVLATNMNVSGNGTVANLFVTTSASFSSAATATTFTNGFNVNGVNVTRPGAGTVAVAGIVNPTGVVSSGRLFAESGESTQVVIGDKGGTAAIAFGSNEDVYLRRVSSTELRVNSAFTVDTLITSATASIGSPSSATKALNIGGDVFIDSNKAIFFGGTSNASGAGNRLVISYNAGNSFIDFATGTLNIRNNSLAAVASFGTASTGTLTLGSGSAGVLIAGTVTANKVGIASTTDFYGGYIQATTGHIQNLGYNGGPAVTVQTELVIAPGFSVTSQQSVNTPTLNVDTVIHNGGGEVDFFSRINMNGNSIINSSDARLKENITEISDESLLNNFARLSSPKWNYIENKNKGIGPLAQQLLETDFAEYIVDTNREFYAVNSSNLSGLTVGAIAALVRKVNELESKLTTTRKKKSE